VVVWRSDAIIDAEAVLAENVKDEASHPVEIAVPAPSISDVDVSQDLVSEVADDFVLMDSDDSGSAVATVPADDNDDSDDNQDQDDRTALVNTPADEDIKEEEGEE